MTRLAWGSLSGHSLAGFVAPMMAGFCAGGVGQNGRTVWGGTTETAPSPPVCVTGDGQICSRGQELCAAEQMPQRLSLVFLSRRPHRLSRQGLSVHYENTGVLSELARGGCENLHQQNSVTTQHTFLSWAGLSWAS